MKKIRITVEVFDANDSVQYDDLPDGWDDWSEKERDAYLIQVAVEAQDTHVGSGATVVDVDENGKEIGIEQDGSADG